MNPTEWNILDGDTAEQIMCAKDAILAAADHAIQLLGDPAADPYADQESPLLIHRNAVGMGEELMCVHESDHPADELLHLYSEQLTLWHLRELATLTGTLL